MSSQASIIALPQKKCFREYPHIENGIPEDFSGELPCAVYRSAIQHNELPTVLDLGAGRGGWTLPMLELGAQITAVDISESRLAILKDRCADYKDKLEIRCLDVFDAITTLRNEEKTYDIVSAIAFLHHIPDYLALIREVVTVLSPHGIFFSYADPLRHDSVTRFTKNFSTLAYVSWRMTRGDIIGGLKRKLRRRKGIYLKDCPHDNVEYHHVREGVDQDAIHKVLEEFGFQCQIVRYFRTPIRLFQSIGTRLGMETTYAVIATKAHS